MNPKFEKLLAGKKKSRSMDDVEKTAKMGILGEMEGASRDMLGDRLQGKLKKVTVASDSKAGLAKGLEKAEDILSDKEVAETEDFDKDVASDMPEGLMDGIEECTPDELEEKIRVLTELKNKKMQSGLES